MPNQQKEPRVNITLSGEPAALMEQIKAAMEKEMKVVLKWPQVIKRLIDNQVKI